MGLRLFLPLILGLSILAASFSAEAAIAFRSKVFDLEPGGFNIDPGEPAGAQADDILIYWMIVQDTFGTITGPTGGWTLIHDTEGSNFRSRVYWIRRGGSAVSTAMSWTGNSYAEGSVAAYSGVINTGSPFDDNVINGYTTGTIVNGPQITTAYANSMAISLGGMWGTTWGSTPVAPGGYTLREGVGGIGQGIVVADKLLGATGAEDPGGYSAAASGEKIEITLSLRDGTSLTAKARMKLTEDSANGSNFTALASADTIAADTTYTLPPADGSAGQILKTNGSGLLGWAFPSTTWSTVTKASNYTVLTSDKNIIFLVSGTTTITLPSPGAVGAGYRVGINNSGSNTVTVSRNATETINGANSFTLTAGEALILITDGTNWFYH